MSRMIRNVLIGSAVAMAASAQNAANLNNIDVATAEAVPTSCSAAQMTTIYNNCVSHCESQMTSAMIECSDINTRYLLVKCAAEADKCGSAAGSSVVKTAQVQRLQDVCKTATQFPLADVKLLFASASDVADSSVAQKTVKDLADSFDQGKTARTGDEAGKTNMKGFRKNRMSLNADGTRNGSIIEGDDVAKTAGLYSGNGNMIPSVIGGNSNDTARTVGTPGMEKRRTQRTNYNDVPATSTGVPVESSTNATLTPRMRKPNGDFVEESSSRERDTKGPSTKESSTEGVREYTWSKGSDSTEDKDVTSGSGKVGSGKPSVGTEESWTKGSGKVGAGKPEYKGTGSDKVGAGKPEYKGIGSVKASGAKGVGAGVGIGAGASVTATKINGTYTNTTQFKSTIKPNSVAKLVPAVSAFFAIAVTAFLAL